MALRRARPARFNAPAMGGGNDDQKRMLDFAIDDAVRELNAAVAMLRSHTSDRITLGDKALANWKGAYADDFRPSYASMKGEATGLVNSMLALIRDLNNARVPNVLPDPTPQAPPTPPR
jgi:hypothetical protein